MNNISAGALKRVLRDSLLPLLLSAALAATLVAPASAYAGAKGGVTVLEGAAWYYDHQGEPSYTLTSGTHMNEFAAIVADGVDFSGKTVILGSNLGNLTIPPIGTKDKPFAGTFDGNGKTITNLKISPAAGQTTYIGLFGRTSTGSAIKNVSLSGGMLTVAENSASGSQIRYVGGIAGYADGSIENCYSSLDISVSSKLAIGNHAGIIRNVGGLAGYISGDMKDCRHSGDISISSASDVSDKTRFLVGEVGGLSGAQGDVEKAAKRPATERCVNSGDITFNVTGTGGLDRFGQQLYSISFAVGGIVGQASGVVKNCTNSAIINTSNGTAENPVAGRGADRTGGIVGDLRGNTFEKVNALQFNNESDYDPGFAYFKKNGGVSGAAISYPTTAAIYDCANTGGVVGLAMVGGIVGRAGTFTEIEGCSNTGDVKGCRWNKSFTAGIGGTVQGDVRYCFNRGDIHSVTGGGYYCAGISGALWSTNDSQTPENEVIPLTEMTGCYTSGRIYTNGAGYRTGILVGENNGYIHDNVYSMSSDDDAVVDSDEGTTVNNTRLSATDLKASKGIGLLNAFAAGAGGWSIFYLPAGGAGVNAGYPVLSRTNFNTTGTLTNINNYLVDNTVTPVTYRDAVYSTTMDPAPLISVGALVQNADYRVIPQSGTKASTPSAITTYSAIIRGMGRYTDSYPDMEYRITKASISDCTVIAAASVFNWKAQKPNWVRVVDASGAEVAGGGDGEYEWRTLHDAGKGTTPTRINGIYHWYDYTNCHGDIYKYDIEVSAKPSSLRYTGTTTQAAFRIAAKSLAGMGEADTPATAVKYEAVQWNGQEWDFKAALDDTTGNYIRIPYTGKPITPTVKRITYLDRELRLAAADWYNRPYDYDYRYIYGNPNPEESNQTSTEPIDVTQDGKPACMTVRHLSSSSFRNYVNVFFTIIPADIAGAAAEPIGYRAYTGQAVEPEVRLTLGDVPLRIGFDYTLSYRNNTGPGTAEITVNGRGNLTGVKTLTFDITNSMTEPAPTDISAATISPVKTRVYTGKALKPAVKLAYKGAALKSGVDYSIKYRNNKIPGKAEIIVTGTGTYAGTKTIYFTIKPSRAKVKSLTAGKGKLTVKFGKPASAQKATNLQLRYRVKGTSKWKTATASVKKSSYVIKKLKKGKKYQVQMRIVRTVKTGYAKGGYYGDWSAIKTGKAIK